MLHDPLTQLRQNNFHGRRKMYAIMSQPGELPYTQFTIVLKRDVTRCLKAANYQLTFEGSWGSMRIVILQLSRNKDDSLHILY
jgi:hypothetical protein